MNGKWIEIFKGGKQVDSSGREHDGSELIDKAIAAFNAEDHEPPVVIGHPKDNAPAWGWVAALRKVGNTLMAQLKDVAPAFADMVKEGRFKKRSASFYPDGRLRHIGFLGAAPPAVKGLKDIPFSDDGDVYEFEEVQETGQDDPANTAGDKDGKNSNGAKQAQGAKKMEFTEEQIDQMKKDAAEAAAKEAREQVEAEFAEKEAKRIKNEIADRAVEFCDQGVKDGTVAPAWVKAGLPEFIASLEAQETADFGETKAVTPHKWFMDFLSGLPKVVYMKEFADRDGDAGEKTITRSEYDAMTFAEQHKKIADGFKVVD